MDPENYPSIKLDDQWIEDVMQEYQSKWIVERLKNIGAFGVLDLGFGEGIVCRSLSNAGFDVTLVDGSEYFADQADKIKNVIGVHSTFEEFETNYRFDCTIASFVLEHVQDPIRLLKRCHQWSDKLIVFVGNANSIHRQVGVQMKLQTDIYSLSDRDAAVGHYMVYDYPLLLNHLDAAGWEVGNVEGFFVKPLNNARMNEWEPELIHALNRVKIPHEISANIGVVCHPKHTVS